MGTEQTAGRLLFAGLAGPELSPADIRAIGDLGPAGYTLFDRNLRSVQQTRELIAGLRECSPRPVLVAIDQEGGSVNRLTRIDELFLRLPAGRWQAGWGEERLERVWEAVGRCLAVLGFDVDFHPVVDLDDSEGANAIGPRSFGTDPGRVTACAAAALHGLASAGIAGCLKHFPGLGGTDLDTHRALATSWVPPKTLWEQHLRPYRELAAAAPFVMMAHAHYPEIDGPAPLPASMSRRIVGEWLRERIGYDGLVVSDDLGMGAVVRRGTPGALAAEAIAAGSDLALFCRDLDTPRHARDELAHRLAEGALDPAAARAAQRRLAAVLAGWPGGRREPAESWESARARLAEQLA
jgi:beta-N-acetylhexosaminidase